MRDEIQRIIKLVQEGKLSPEDAAELIDAFQGSDEVREAQASTAGPNDPPKPPDAPDAPGNSRDPFRSIIDAIEKSAREATQNVNWQEVASQTRESATRGFEALRQGLDQIAKGKLDLGFILQLNELKEVNLPINAVAGKRIRIENPLGDVRVIGGTEAPFVKAQARFRGGSQEELKAKAEAYTLVIEENGDQVVVRQPDVVGLHVDLEFKVQSGVEVEIRSESGDIMIMDTLGPARVTSRSGDLNLKGLQGIIDVNSDSGDVRISDSASDVTIVNKSGDLSVERLTGSINARTASGDVNLRGLKVRALSLESVSGDVSVEFDESISGTVSIRAVNGDTNLSVPDGGDCRVILSTLRGDVNCNLPLEDESKQEQRITGRLGAGTGTLDVSAVTGDVNVELKASAVNA